MNIPYIFKRCSKCGQWLVANEIYFYKEKKCRYGLRSQCKKCEAEQKKKYRQDNKKQIAEQKKEYYQNNKGYFIEYRKQYYQDNREQIAERDKQYYQNNKEEILERNKQHYQNNKEEILERNKQYYQNNREQRIKHKREYYRDNRGQILEQKRKYRKSPQGQVNSFNATSKRRQKEEQQGRGLTSEMWLEAMNFFNWTGAYSGITLTKNNRSIDHIIPLDNGGLNEPWNCVPMERSLNSSKKDKDMLTWYKEQEFYSEERLAKIYEWQEYAFNKWGQDVAM